jgi:hypothetical protein
MRTAKPMTTNNRSGGRYSGFAELRYLHRALFLASIALLMTFKIEDASAYTYLRVCGSTPARWASNLYAANAHTSFSSGPWRTALASVVQSWDNNPSNLAVRVAYGDPSIGLQNGQSEVWWATNPGADALTYPWVSLAGCRYTEADIIFKNNPSVPWTDSANKPTFFTYGGGYRPFHATGIHEFGHAAGLGHTNNFYSVMGTDYTYLSTNGQTARAYIGADASAGVIALYGLWANGPDDLSVVHWRWNGTATGEYADHCRTRMFNSAGGLLLRVAGNPCYGAEPVFQVSRGQTVQVEFTYENLGRNNRTFAVGYFVSSNSTINTADQFLGANSITLPRQNAWSAATRLVVPTNLARGYYWLGAIVDYNNAIGERLENNNASYVQIFVQ